MDKINGSGHPIRLVLIDLDGTFLRDDKSIPEENLSALEFLENQGIPYSIATGRSYVSALPYLEHFPSHVPAILQNGALVMYPCSKEIIHQFPLEESIANYIFQRAENYDLHCVISRGWLEDACLWLNKPYEGVYSAYLQNHGVNFEVICPQDSLKQGSVTEIVLMGSEFYMHQLINETVQKFGQNFSIIKSFDWQGETFLEIMGPSVSKSHSLVHLCDHFGISASSVLFIGDNYNDLDAMRTAGYPVAVANALDHVKALACFISKSNNDGGVGHAIRTLLQDPSLHRREAEPYVPV